MLTSLVEATRSPPARAQAAEVFHLEAKGALGARRPPSDFVSRAPASPCAPLRRHIYRRSHLIDASTDSIPTSTASAAYPSRKLHHRAATASFFRSERSRTKARKDVEVCIPSVALRRGRSSSHSFKPLLLATHAASQSATSAGMFNNSICPAYIEVNLAHLGFGASNVIRQHDTIATPQLAHRKWLHGPPRRQHRDLNTGNTLTMKPLSFCRL